MHVAARWKHADLVPVLVESGADVDWHDFRFRLKKFFRLSRAVFLECFESLSV
jgi:hypothetical protein